MIKKQKGLIVSSNVPLRRELCVHLMRQFYYVHWDCWDGFDPKDFEVNVDPKQYLLCVVDQKDLSLQDPMIKQVLDKVDHQVLIGEQPVRLHEWLTQVQQILIQCQSVVCLGTLQFMPIQRRLVDQQGREVCLTEKEVRLLEILLQHFPGALSKDFLLQHVWEYEEGVNTRTLETHIYRLRQKMSGLHGGAHIKTEDEGYGIEWGKELEQRPSPA